MAKIHFTDHLDDMMDRLMHEDITEEELESNIKKSKALCDLAEKKIRHNESIIKASKLYASGVINSGIENLLPQKK